MTEKLPQRDGRGAVERHDQRELPSVAADRRVQVQLAPLDQLHDGHGVEDLRDRAGAKDRVGPSSLLEKGTGTSPQAIFHGIPRSRLRASPLFQQAASGAEAGRMDQSLVIHQRQRQAADAVRRHLFMHRLVQPLDGLCIVGRKRGRHSSRTPFPFSWGKIARPFSSRTPVATSLAISTAPSMST